MAFQCTGLLVSAVTPLLGAYFLCACVGQVSSGHHVCRFSPLQHRMACFSPLHRDTKRRRLVVLAGLGSVPAGELSCVRATPRADSGTLCVGGIRGRCQLAAEGWCRGGGGPAWPCHVPLPHCPGGCFGELLGCLSRADNALSVGDWVTVNNVRIAWKIPFRSTAPQVFWPGYSQRLPPPRVRLNGLWFWLIWVMLFSFDESR